MPNMTTQNTLSDEELERVLTTAREWALSTDQTRLGRSNARLGLYAWIAFLTGLRISEICRAEWPQWRIFDKVPTARVWCHKKRKGKRPWSGNPRAEVFGGQTRTISLRSRLTVLWCHNKRRGRKPRRRSRNPRSEVFRGQLRTIPLCSRLTEFLKLVARPQGEIILSEVTSAHYRRRYLNCEATRLRNKIHRIQATWPRLFTAADVTPIRVHDARHTFSTLVYRKTHDLRTLQALLGHSSIVTTMIYTHSDLLLLQAAVDLTF